MKYLFSDNNIQPPAGLSLDEQHTWRASMIGAVSGYITEELWLDLRKQAAKAIRKEVANANR